MTNKYWWDPHDIHMSFNLHKRKENINISIEMMFNDEPNKFDAQFFSNGDIISSKWEEFVSYWFSLKPANYDHLRR